MKKHAHDGLTPEQFKSVFDDISADDLAEMESIQISEQDLESADVTLDKWGSEPVVTAASEQKMGGLARTVTVIGGLAAAVVMAVGIGKLVQANQPEIGVASSNLTAENSSQENVTIIAPDETNAAKQDSAMDATTTECTLQSVTDSKDGVSSADTVMTKDHWNDETTTKEILATTNTTAPKSNTTTVTTTGICSDPKQTTVTTDQFGYNGIDPNAFTLEKVKQIIAESNTFAEMYDKINEICSPYAHYGSGIDHSMYYIDSGKSEYIEVVFQQSQIFYHLGKDEQVLYEPETPDYEAAKKIQDNIIADYLRKQGYSESEIRAIRSAKVDISACSQPQIAVGFVTYLETQYYNPITKDELPFIFNHDTTDYLGWNWNNGKVFLNFMPPIYEHISVNEKLYPLDHPDDDGYNGRLFIEFNDGFNWCDQFSICNLYFETRNIDDIQLDGKCGQSHVIYLCDFDADRSWTYDDLIVMYQYAVEYKVHSSAVHDELFCYFSLSGSDKQGSPQSMMKKLCDVLAGRSDTLN